MEKKTSALRAKRQHAFFVALASTAHGAIRPTMVPGTSPFRDGNAAALRFLPTTSLSMFSNGVVDASQNLVRFKKGTSRNRRGFELR